MAARQADSDVKAFVFFCNVDLTPSEIEKLERFAHEHGFSHVDIYWRERLRHALDSVEGLALRYQYLGIKLSDAEQAAFFARFGKDLEDLLHGRFDRIEQKLDELEFARWRTGHIRSLELDMRFRSFIESKHQHPEHFRVALELQGVQHERRSIIFGGRDDFWPANDGTFYFGTKVFFWREQVGKIQDSWIKAHTRAGGGVVGGITLALHWRPASPILAAEFDGLCRQLHFTENLVNRLDRVRFTIDDYVFLDWKFSSDDLLACMPSLGWPDKLTEEESKVGWLCKDLWYIHFDQAPQKRGQITGA